MINDFLYLTLAGAVLLGMIGWYFFYSWKKVWKE